MIEDFLVLTIINIKKKVKENVLFPFSHGGVSLNFGFV